MATWRYEISLLVLKKYFTRSVQSLMKYFSTLGEKFHISVQPCNILYIQQISIREINKYCVIYWIGIYPVDTIIHHLNNWSLKGIP